MEKMVQHSQMSRLLADAIQNTTTLYESMQLSKYEQSSSSAIVPKPIIELHHQAEEHPPLVSPQSLKPSSIKRPTLAKERKNSLSLFNPEEKKSKQLYLGDTTQAVETTSIE